MSSLSFRLNLQVKPCMRPILLQTLVPFPFHNPLYLHKSFQKHISIFVPSVFSVFFLSITFSNVSNVIIHIIHTHKHIFSSLYVSIIHIKICLISSSVVTTIMSNVTILLDGHLWFCRPLLRGGLQSSNPLTPRLSLFSDQLCACHTNFDHFVWREIDKTANLLFAAPPPLV